MNHFRIKETFGDRLVRLSNGQEGLRGRIDSETRVHEGGDPIIDFIASDSTLDRYDEVIEASGWDLRNYSKNPVFLNSHQYGDISFVLGKSLVHEVSNGKLFQRILFAVESNPVARLAFNLYRDGFLNGVSVGFIPIEWVTGDTNAGFRRRFTKQELLELSAVAIPANPNALQMALQKGCVTRADVREATDLMESYKGVLGSEAAEEHLFRDISDLRQVISGAL